MSPFPDLGNGFFSDGVKFFGVGDVIWLIPRAHEKTNEKEIA